MRKNVPCSLVNSIELQKGNEIPFGVIPEIPSFSHLRNFKQAKNTTHKTNEHEKHLMNVNEPLRKLARMMCKEAKAPKHKQMRLQIPYND